MSSPSMVHRSGDTLVVRSVVSGDALYQDGDTPEEASILDEVDANNGVGNDANNDGDEDELDLPQCKIKRNYTCPSCDYYSQNPRSYLYHLKDVHKQKIRVYECPSCLYASKHSQKLQRHVHMVHVMNKRGKQKMNTKKKPKKAAPMVAILPRQSLLIKSDGGGGGGAIAQQHAYTSSSSSIAAAPNQLLSAALSKGDEGAPGGGPGELLTCSICGFATRNVSAMSRHEKLVHLKKRFFRCTKCNYVTHMRARYTKHVKYHSMPMIKCDLCDFRTPYKWNLDRHYKNHQGDGAYKCSLCNFTADIKQSLTVHEMNHHVPPVGQVAGAGTGRRRNKVGASDSMQQGQESDMIDQEEMELLRLERENEEDVDNAGEQIGLQFFHIPVVNSESTVAARQKNNEHTINMRNGRVLENSQKAPKIKISFKKIKVLHLQPQRPSNLTTQPNIKCKLCNFKASWEAELTLHELQVHNVQRRPKVAKKVPRPIPNLIPIQNKSTTSPPPLGSLPILKIPSVRTRTGPTPLKPAVLLDQPADSKMSEKDLNEICAKSCPNSSLRDFASLMGGDTYIEEGSEVAAVKSEPKSDDDAVSPHGSPDPKLSSIILSASTTFKKKNASFFDKLKEKLMVGTGETYNLTCWCGHESKCLSELMRHQKLHNDGLNLGRSLKGGGTILTAGAELSSTRCQHCRQRCKTSSDLFNHLQSCPEASKVLNSSNSAHEGSIEDQLIEKEATPVPQVQPEPEPKEKKEEESQGLHPMENKVFVWNNMPQLQEAECEEECLQQMPPDALPNEEDSLDTSVRSKSPISEGSLIGIETAPGYGAVTSNADTDTLAITPSDKPVKKVFKCPHCTFWASTASRFHVHIVGHLNKKPFECSLCAYRSNWRWDITKHIRLKSARDPNHESAGVLMTDETGRRNYSKYNKYLTMMRVHEPSAESSGSGRRTKGSEATQGTSKLQHPPHLTPPTPSTASATSLRTGPLRPPPPLRVAHHVLFLGPPPLRPKPKKGAVKRVSRGIFDQEGPPPAKRPSVDGKKTTLWKCKKCNFRDARRELVMAHVKEHYQQREMQQMAAAAQSTPPTVAGGETNADGERHCRLKHSGDVQVVRGGRSRIVIEESAVEETSEPEQSGGDGTKQCEICPFSSLSSNEMAIHKEHHSSWPGASYKCNFCLYFVSQKKDLVAHLRLHGVSDPEDYLAKNTQSKSPANQSGSDDDTDEMGQQLLPGDSNPTKRYKCVGCPYVSNSKSQFLYHKQFHRPRDAPFKCGLCSYNVSRRHLLHQHLRVHGIVVPPQKSPPKHLGGGGGGYDASDDGADEIEEVTVGSPQSADTRLELDTKAMLDIPLVWVSRGTSFYKMYKCRFCPHVNVRKANIHEHEKMHTVRTKVGAAAGGGGGEGAAVTAVEVKKEPGQVAVATAAVVQQHRCPDCNYVCNNAGVLSSHAKVHQGMYGRVHCLVDATRTDEAQLQDLAGENLVHSDDDGSGVATPPREYASAEDIPEPDLEPQKQQDSVKDYSMKSIMSRPAEVKTDDEKDTRLLYFCSHCPARFLFEKESSIHSRFHEINLAHRCESCSYTARQRPHLLAHHKVHADEYQERTNELVGLHRTSPQHPRPRTAVIVEGPGVVGAVWVVIAGGSGGETHMEHSTSVEVKPRDDTKPAASTPTNRVPGKQYSCGVCPATFFKSVALQYHMTLHGGAGPHHCRFCDYAVKTYGNLVKHEMIHGEHGKSTLKNKVLLPTQSVPLSGTDLFQHRAEVQRNDALMSANNYQLTTYLSSPPPLHIDPQFGILMHGNPDYVYPTYFKNGRLKEKRYKCHKCPSAFEKREQYKVHLTLHGAKQRYRCEKCDYSVKYYANYIQHIRKHQTNDKAMTSRKSETPPKDGDASDQSTDEHAEYEDKAPIQLSFRSAKTICLPSAVQDGPLQLSVADRQSLMLQKLKRTNAAGNSPEPEEPKKVFYCPHCPYSSQRRDGVESHVKRHEAVSGVRGAFVCDHCDYSVPQQHFLREHNKVHFTAAKKQPEAYMKCSRMELWVENQGKENITDDVGTQTEDENANEKVVVFKDHGSIKSDVNRFYPVLSSDVVDLAAEDEEKVYVNILTGEPIGEDVLQAGSPETNELDTLVDDTKVVSASDIVDKTDDEMELHQSGSVSSGSSNLCPETGLKLVAEINRSTSSLSSAALDEESKMDVISDCDTNDSENAKDKASVNQNAEDSDGLVN